MYFQEKPSPTTAQSNRQPSLRVQDQAQFKQLDPNDESYFHLMELVGIRGKYQTSSLIIWCVIWFIAGSLLIGTPFLLYNPPYINCPQDITQATCNEYVCKLPQQNRQKYLDNKVRTLANQFGDYHCQKSIQIQITNSLVYFGSMIGYLVVSWMNDNLGRKKSIMIGLSIALLGITLITFSFSLLMAQVGLLLAGFGIDPSINTVFYFIAQTVQNHKRQKQSILIQFFFCLAGIVNVMNFAIFKNWRVIYIFFFLIPAIISFVIVWWFIQQTPQFMIMLFSPQQMLESLKKIAISNQSPFFTYEQNQALLLTHIQKLQTSYKQKLQSSHHNYLTIKDMFRYPSIRFTSIYVCVLSFSIYMMYYGPLMLIEKYNLNMYVSALVITSSEIVLYPFLYFWVDRMNRRMWAKVFFGVDVVCAILLLFVLGSNDTLMKTVQMVLIFVFRFCISFEFSLFAVYCTQLFPSQIKGIAIGFASALGTVASSSSPILFGQLQKTSFPVMIIFICLGSLSFLCSFYLPETLNGKLSEQLEEFGQDLDQEEKPNGQQAHKEGIQLVQEIVEGQGNGKKR